MRMENCSNDDEAKTHNNNDDDDTPEDNPHAPDDQPIELETPVAG